MSEKDPWNRPDDPDRVREVLSGRGLKALRIERLAGDASTRAYLRVLLPSGETMMATVYPHPGRHEEDAFLETRTFLEDLGLPVPKLVAVDPDRSVVLLEDLGDRLLESAIEGAPPASLISYYRSAVSLLVDLRNKTAGLSSGCPAFGLAFDEEKLMGEFHFCADHFIRGLCGLRLEGSAQRELELFFLTISRVVAAEPRIFAHRDYHCRNLMVRDGSLVMIDFQDARMGPAQYDLASLLRDSYVELLETVVEDLIDSYLVSVGTTGPHGAEGFRRIFDLTALQRNIKAIGTFGYQASVRGTGRYLSAVPRTARYVMRNMARYDELRRFRSVVEDFITRPGLAVQPGHEVTGGM